MSDCIDEVRGGSGNQERLGELHAAVLQSPRLECSNSGNTGRKSFQYNEALTSRIESQTAGLQILGTYYGLKHLE